MTGHSLIYDDIISEPIAIPSDLWNEAMQLWIAIEGCEPKVSSLPYHEDDILTALQRGNRDGARGTG